MLEFFGFDFTPLVMGLVGGAISAVFMFWGWIKSYVAKTEAKWDDALVKGLEDAFNKQYAKNSVQSKVD